MKYFEQSHVARNNVSKLWLSLLVPSPMSFPILDAGAVLRVLALTQKPLRLRVRLRGF